MLPNVHLELLVGIMLLPFYLFGLSFEKKKKKCEYGEQKSPASMCDFCALWDQQYKYLYFYLIY